MNYRNLTMDEMVNRLSSEPDRDTFIEISKAFIQKWVDGDYITKDNLNATVAQAREDGMDKGYAEAKEICQDEMIQYIESEIGKELGVPIYEKLLRIAKTIG